MRLHRLELTAFGPFGGHQVIDFDRLTDSGLFLLHGPTGAGKSTILDAVCFALYGSVPGARGRSRGPLRSDHAAAAAEPRVVCEVTLSGRRFEITRVAEWQRPKRRGAGTVREHATVLLREWVDGRWRSVSNRIDEAAEEIQRLTGLGADQFTTLVLLPQGEFATFLRAKADERKPLLQKLFGTDRFESVESWLVQRRRDLAVEATDAQHRLEQLLARADQARLLPSEPSAEPPSQARAEPRPRPPAEPESLVAAWLADARAAAARARARVAETDPQDDLARAALEAGRRAARLQARHHELTVRREQLAAGESEQAARREQVRGAAAAAMLAPLLADLTEAETVAARAAAGLSAAALEVREDVQASGAGGATPHDDPTVRLRSLHRELDALTELVEVEHRLHAVDVEVGEVSGDLERARAELARCERVLGLTAGERTDVARRREAAALLAARLPDREHGLQRANEVARAADERRAAALELAQQEVAVREAFEHYRATADRVLDLRARRLDGMAAELAESLTDGDGCPVCGSAEHPAPAVPADARVTRADETEAAADRDAAREALTDAESAREDAAHRLATAAATAGRLQPDEAAAALALAAARCAQAQEAVTAETHLQARLGILEAQITGLEAEREIARGAVEAVGARLAGVLGRREPLAENLAEHLSGATAGPEAFPGFDAQARRVGSLIAAWEALATARQVEDDARRTLHRLRAAATAAARRTGFDDLGQARAALLPPAETDVLATAITAFDDAVAQLDAQLADPELAAAAAPQPDLDDLQVAATASRQARSEAAEQHALATRASSTLGVLLTQVTDHLASTRPMRERFALVESISRTAEGAGENDLRMRLSAFVLAARLEEVAQAAGHHLAAMSDGRFSLRHDDGPARRGARSGLGLLVVDSWTGVERDPATLSGGETFCTSLALALGLADVVSAEAGGARLETLLVDEGFGSLDDETLERVLDVVDGLRSGGRAVGLVSHVADLRQRIPAQVEVVKTRTGSSVLQHLPG